MIKKSWIFLYFECYRTFWLSCFHLIPVSLLEKLWWNFFFLHNHIIKMASRTLPRWEQIFDHFFNISNYIGRCDYPYAKRFLIIPEIFEERKNFLKLSKKSQKILNLHEKKKYFEIFILYSILRCGYPYITSFLETVNFLTETPQRTVKILEPSWEKSRYFEFYVQGFEDILNC